MEKKLDKRIATGVPGLDEIIYGGFIPERAYLVRGGPGTGKTTLGLHYLAAGAVDKEQGLFICMGEQEEGIRENAGTMGIDLGNVVFLDLSPDPESFSRMENYSIFSPAEVERTPITQKIMEQIEKLKPNRIFIDSMTQFRYLSADSFQFRRQAASFLRFLTEQGTTVLFTSESCPDMPDDDLMFLSDGIIELEANDEDHRLTVRKFRGSGFHTGRQFVRLNSSGMEVFPRLLPKGVRGKVSTEAIPTGVPELNELLHGGLERGTITIISGPSGVGKTTLGLLFLREAAKRGEHPVLYAFEEGMPTLINRCEAINIHIRDMMEQGSLSVVKVEPLIHSPEEFTRMVRKEVEEQGARVVMLDSTAGYGLSIRGGDLIRHLHALCKYLAELGVTTILINEVEFITGEFRATEIGVSYIADNIIFMRYLELNAQLKKAIGVLKKRLSDFEKNLREIKITPNGVEIGPPLTGLRGILKGMPETIESLNDEE